MVAAVIQQQRFTSHALTANNNARHRRGRRAVPGSPEAAAVRMGKVSSTPRPPPRPRPRPTRRRPPRSPSRARPGPRGPAMPRDT
eukprot:scaffold113857_cov51-Phaeocystis_antarctica.AAC.2